MNKTRWQQIEKLYFAALEQPPAARSRFLAAECDGDADLRREVESLLKSSEKADDFLPQPDFELGLRLLTEPHRSLRPQQKFGDYKILKFIGGGGMGEVYLAQDARLERRVALKLLPRAVLTDADRIRRFRREARTSSQITHHNVAQIYETGEAEGNYFIAMEFVDGATLRERLKSPISFDEILEIAEQIAAALAAAAEVGVVHRDLKPENVMLRRDKLVKVLDFGLAKLSPRFDSQPDNQTSGENDRSVSIYTEPGLLMGTATYMSPEQARGMAVDHRGDVWSLGVILYEMLTGHLPFAGETKSDVIAAVLHGEPAPLKNYQPNLPAEAERIIAKALDKNRDERYQTARDFSADLQSLRPLLASRAVTNQTAQASEFSAENLNKITVAEINPIINPNEIQSSAEFVVKNIKRHKFPLLAVLLTVLIGAAAWNIVQPDSSKPLPFSAASRANLQISTLFDTKRKSGGAIRNLSFSPDSGSHRLRRAA